MFYCMVGSPSQPGNGTVVRPPVVLGPLPPRTSEPPAQHLERREARQRLSALTPKPPEGLPPLRAGRPRERVMRDVQRAPLCVRDAAIVDNRRRAQALDRLV